MSGGLRQAGIVARRELASFFYAPIAYVLLVLFLVVEGLSFTAVLNAAADPLRPAPLGAVLRTFFGGTFLHWSCIFAVIAAVSMRLVSEERSKGTWEALVTAPASEASIVVGKWLGALGFYLFLWLPTWVYVMVLFVYAPSGGGPDMGPIVSAYLGVALSGGAFLALGLAASSFSKNQIVSAVAAFVVLLLLFFVGQLGEVAAGFVTQHPLLAGLVRVCDLKTHQVQFSRGIISLSRVLLYVGIVVLSLTCASVALRVNRHGGLGRGAIGIVLVLAITALANVLAARHPVRLDVTAQNMYTLDARTTRVLAEVHFPVRVWVMAAATPEFAELYDEVGQVLQQFALAQPRIIVEHVDPIGAREQAIELADRYRLDAEELVGGGVVVFASGDRHRAIGLLDMADFASDEMGAGRVARFTGEAKFANALAEVTAQSRPTICLTVGHGELAADGPLAVLMEAVQAEGFQSLTFGLAQSVPKRCAAVAIVGPRLPFSSDQAIVISEYLRGGGRVLVALSPASGLADHRPALGLDTVLASYGVVAEAATVLDPAGGSSPTNWPTLQGYGRHPVVAGFQGRRATLWLQPRWLRVAQQSDSRKIVSLVTSSAESWVAIDPKAPAPASAVGPAPVAIAVEDSSAGGRLVVLGSSESFTNATLRAGAGANDMLFVSAISWLTRLGPVAPVFSKTPEQFRVVMTSSQMSDVLILCVVLLPIFSGLLGVVVYWRRRRGASS